MAYGAPDGATRTRIVLIVVAVALQLAIAPQVSIAGGRINFMLILAVVSALDGDAPRAVLTGFMSGLLFDLSSPVPVGLMALLLTIASFALASTGRSLSAGLTMDSVRLVGVTALAVNLIYASSLLLMGLENDVLIALVGHGLTSAVLDSILSVPFLALGGAHAGQRAASARLRGTRLKEKR